MKTGKTLVVGDRVAYSANWLRSTGQQTGPMPFARGSITELRVLSKETIIAVVDWNDPEIPPRVNLANLARVGPNRDFCAV